MTERATKPARSTPRPGIREVANRAGVAVSSVSRVLSKHPDVSDAMRKRVDDAVAELGYQPDRLAQSMRTGATQTVGFVVGDISNLLMSQIALGAETRLRESGYSTLLTNSLNDPKLDLDHLTLLRQRRVDGLLLSLNDETDPGVIGALTALDVPAVLVDREVDDLDLSAALSDHAAGMRAAIDHLVALGHRHIGLVNGNPKVRPSRERATELTKATTRHEGLIGTVLPLAFTALHGHDATIEMLSVYDNGPTALIAGGNQVLVGMLRALREMGKSIPHDVSVVTCDDLPLSEFLEPELSTISRDPGRLGQEAAGLLLERLAKAPPRRLLLPTTFRPTASCSPPTTKGA